MWIPIRVTSQESPAVVTDTHAAYIRPDVPRVTGSLSSEHEIKYQGDDLPDLTEGDGVEFLDEDGTPIDGKTFRVRQVPFVSDDPNDDTTGYFMRALLTRL
jgi:hypothetical protein